MEEEQFGDFNGDSYDSQSDVTMGAMSDMVQSMASTIYSEFEKLISAYGNGVVEGLMPQLVGILENWDKALKEKQDVQLELDLTKEDNDQLLSQYEREKTLRKAADQRNMEIEDIIEEQKKDLQAKLDHVNTNYKVLEVKSKNYLDQVSRLEDKETEVREEYDKLHGRYTELFKSHMDMMERTKVMMATEKSQSESESRQSTAGGPRHSGSNFVSAPSPNTEDPPTEGQTTTGQMVQLGGPEVITARDSHSNVSIRSEMNDHSGNSLALSVEAAVFDELDPEDSVMTGMTKEVENLIKENQELIQTKNALNVVKDDLISQLDELTGTVELVKGELHQVKSEKTTLDEKYGALETQMKELVTKQKALENQENEEDVPRAQRKRFTRAEMARVLMERNQYKERLMELQEAVRWTEMIRAAKENPQNTPKKKSGLWGLFSDLFSSQKARQDRLPTATVHYNAPASHLQPVGDPNKPRENNAERPGAFDFLKEDAAPALDLLAGERLTEQSRKQKEEERSKQYRQVQAHVNKDDGRVQAYSWSVPTKSVDHRTGNISVPVPVYCRPLELPPPVDGEGDGPGPERTNLWCAAAVYKCAGRTRDGGSLVGASSLFYSDTETSPPADDGPEMSSSPNISQLNAELQEHQQILKESSDVAQMSSLVWLCTTCGRDSRVQVINAGNPSEVLESISIDDAQILTIASIPGVSERDYPAESASHNCLLEGAAGDTGEGTDPDDNRDPVDIKFVDVSSSNTSTASERYESLSEKLSSTSLSSAANAASDIAPNSPSDDNRRLMLPTMWIGLQNGLLLIHSSINEWTHPIRTIDLGDCILCTQHIHGKVFVGLANGTVVAFHRNSDGVWCFQDYHVIDLGQDKVPIRAICAVGAKHLWIGHRNYVFVVDVTTLQVTKQFVADERTDSQVRLLVWSGDGVWVAMRNESVLHLYHAYNMELLQDINIESCVDKLIGVGKPGLTRVTALEISCNRLWIGTGNGVIVSLPLSIENLQDTSKAVDIPGRDITPGGLVRVYCDKQGDKVTPASFVPYCDLSLAQLSFHGHRDSVRFVATIAGNSKETSLVMSGGDGYVDFRFDAPAGDGTESLDPNSPSFWSHLIVWEVSNNLENA